MNKLLMSVVLPASCEGCGACCRGWEIEVWWSDVVPLRLRKEDRLLGPVMRQRGGACIAPTKDRRCSLYETRPKVCRDFERGSAECQRKLGAAITRNEVSYEQPVSP